MSTVSPIDVANTLKKIVTPLYKWHAENYINKHNIKTPTIFDEKRSPCTHRESLVTDFGEIWSRELRKIDPELFNDDFFHSMNGDNLFDQIFDECIVNGCEPSLSALDGSVNQLLIQD